MKDSILDWVESHRKLVLTFLVILILIVVIFIIRSYNLSKKSNVIVEDTSSITPSVKVEVSQEPVVSPTPSYQSSLNDRADDKKNNSDIKVPIEDETLPEIKPNFEVSCSIFEHTSVPDKNVDGSSCKNYLASVKLADFDTFWGTTLDINDMQSTTKYLVGVDQDNIDEEIADLQSVGWLISNCDALGKHDAIKFTNLHVIGSLSKSHVAILCSYDWYSVFGLKDTLVLFEDISGTLDSKDFKEGSIFSATVFVHNIKIKKVNGQNVVCVQYNVFN